MKYYFYDKNGNVDLIYHVEPPEEMLNSQKYIVSDLVFENKPNMFTIYKVNLETKELYVEYKERAQNQKDREIKILQQEVAELKEQVKAIQQTLSIKQ